MDRTRAANGLPTSYFIRGTRYNQGTLIKAMLVSFLFSAFVYACCYTRLTHFRWKFPNLRAARPVGPN